MYVSVETPEATDLRLRQVIKEAELEWLADRFVFVEYPRSAFPEQEISGALAFVRDDEVWSVLRPATADAGEIVAVFRVHFRPDADNSGFVGWLATLIKHRLGTGVFVVCGQNGRRGGIFDYWGVPIAQRENAAALLAELQL